MKSNHAAGWPWRFLAALCGLLIASPVFAVEDNATLIREGAYIARAADCIACHRSKEKGGDEFAGGYVIDSPMGKIVASNITPSNEFGIGSYSEQQLANALRKGVNAKGQHLYPAMPYTSYSGMSDHDIHALYVYLQRGVKPVDKAAPSTHLVFPFNIRALMFGWNFLFLDRHGFVPAPGVSKQVNRGRYLVDNLAHCGACHTPRNVLMAENRRQYLGGAVVAGWVAPNITSDKASGVGGWSNDDLVSFLKRGHLPNKAQAAGGMAEAVENSFRYLSDDDLHAMAAYLKTVLAISNPDQPARGLRVVAPVDMSAVESGQGTQASLADSSGTDGARLYIAACASCHGLNGQGTSDHFYPSLSQNSALNGTQANNLVMTVIHGIDRDGADLKVNMPAFGDDLNDEQIAAIANYSLQTFGNPALSVTPANVATMREGEQGAALVTAMPYMLALLALMVLAGLIVAMRWLRKRERRR